MEPVSFIKPNLRNDAPVVVVWTQPCVRQVTAEGIPSHSEACRFAPCSSCSFSFPVLFHTLACPVCGSEVRSCFSLALRKSLREMAERLADKYEEAKEKQEDIMNR